MPRALWAAGGATIGPSPTRPGGPDVSSSTATLPARSVLPHARRSRADLRPPRAAGQHHRVGPARRRVLDRDAARGSRDRARRAGDPPRSRARSAGWQSPRSSSAWWRCCSRRRGSCSRELAWRLPRHRRTLMSMTAPRDVESPAVSTDPLRDPCRGRLRGVPGRAGRADRTPLRVCRWWARRRPETRWS